MRTFIGRDVRMRIAWSAAFALVITIVVSLLAMRGLLAAPASAHVNERPTGEPDRNAVAAPSAREATSGRQLGVITLGASETDVIAALGRPTRETISHGLGSPRWEYSDGYVVEFAGVARRVWQIQISAPARGATTEGFAIGQSVTEFRTSYAGSQVQEFVIEGDRQLQVTMPGELLIATFPPNSGAASLLLRTDPGPP